MTNGQWKYNCDGRGVTHCAVILLRNCPGPYGCAAHDTVDQGFLTFIELRIPFKYNHGPPVKEKTQSFICNLNNNP